MALVQSISPTHSKRVFKILVLGDPFVGKTSITYRFCENKFLERPEATIGVDFRERTVSINGEDIKLQIWDTAGQERFRKSMVNHYYRNANGVIIVYDVTNLSSFMNVAVWLNECESHNVSDQIPMILVGNKCDCSDVQVSTNLAQRIADAYGMPLFETSANSESESNNIEAIFSTLAHKLSRQQSLMPVSKFASLEFQENLHRANILTLTDSPATSYTGYCWC